ncbi:MAG: type II toxin-antitoxin system VapC family toxin [Acidobacteriales bacterium]|nr:MAG: type II toxin-antitoxin system VapC family toxin [Terriglobales bacterium]
MRLLLDTHAFLWAIAQPEKLSKRAARLITDEANQLLLSTASLWEIVLKVQAGKLKLPGERDFLPQQLASLNVECLPVEADHVMALLSLPTHHRDPFDRLLAAQCQVEHLAILTADAAVREYPIETIW